MLIKKPPRIWGTLSGRPDPLNIYIVSGLKPPWPRRGSEGFGQRTQPKLSLPYPQWLHMLWPVRSPQLSAAPRQTQKHRHMPRGTMAVSGSNLWTPALLRRRTTRSCAARRAAASGCCLCGPSRQHTSAVTAAGCRGRGGPISWCALAAARCRLPLRIRRRRRRRRRRCSRISSSRSTCAPREVDRP